MYWDAIEVRSIARRELAIRLADGLAGVVCIDASFCTGVFEPLKSDDGVSCAIIENGVLAWPNGLDLAPDTLYREIKRNPQRRYELKRKT